MESFLHDLSWVLPLRSDIATAIFNGFTALGYLPFYLVLLPLGYWLWDKAMFTRLAVLIMASALLMRLEGGPRLLGYPAIALLLFLAAAVLGFGIVISALLRDRHAKAKGTPGGG